MAFFPASKPYLSNDRMTYLIFGCVLKASSRLSLISLKEAPEKGTLIALQLNISSISEVLNVSVMEVPVITAS